MRGILPMKQFVDIETPYSAKTESDLSRNLLYTRACIRDSLLRGEIPFASHLFYTQPGILDDTVQTERDMGILAGKELIEGLPGVKTVVYTDLGISPGMQFGIDRAESQSRIIEYRTLSKDWETKAREISITHAHAKAWGLETNL